MTGEGGNFTPFVPPPNQPLKSPPRLIFRIQFSQAKQSATNALTVVSKQTISTNAKNTGHLIGNKYVDKNTKNYHEIL